MDYVVGDAPLLDWPEVRGKTVRNGQEGVQEAVGRGQEAVQKASWLDFALLRVLFNLVLILLVVALMVVSGLYLFLM